MIRKIVAVWVSLAVLFGFIVIVDVITDFTPTVRATTLYVNETGSGGAYKSIQDAINVSSDGDTVFVYMGTYYEHVIVNRTINLTGENKNTTIIDGSGSGDVVIISANWVNMSELKITNGGDGIGLDFVSNCKISNCNVSNMMDVGIGLGSSTSNTIASNSISNTYSGIIVTSSSSNIILNNSVSDNIYGIYIRFEIGWPTSPDYNIVIRNNVSNNTYGIIIFTSSNNNITNNNVSNSSYGLYFLQSSNNNITGNNVSSSNGPGIFLDNSSNNNITNCKISHCYIGTYLNNSLNNFIYKCNFSEIKARQGAASQGGTGEVAAGIYLYHSTFNIVENNTISDVYGGKGQNSPATGLAAGCGGVGAGIFLANSIDNDISLNKILNVKGGEGGEGGPGSWAGPNQRGVGIFIDDDSLKNNIKLSNTMDYELIHYFYNQHGVRIENQLLTATVNPTNLGKIVLINCSEFVIENNTIENFLGLSGYCGGAWKARGGNGYSGAGVFIQNVVDSIVSHNTISNINGGLGGNGGHVGSGGEGGLATGIYISNCANITSFENLISYIVGGKGGGGGWGGSGGVGGIASGIYLEYTQNNNFYSNTILDMTGGKGGLYGPGTGGIGNGVSGAQQEGVGLHFGDESENNEVSMSNSVNGEKVLYFYNATNIHISGENLAAYSNPTNLGKIVLINCSDFKIANITISGFKGLSGTTGDPYIDNAGEGEIGVGVRVQNSENISITRFVIYNLKGGVGGTSGVIGAYPSTGGKGGDASGIFLDNCSDHIISRGVCYELTGGPSGKGNLGPDGVEGIGKAVYLVSSNSTNVTENTMMNSEYGLMLINSSGCNIYHNNFIDNIYQAYDNNINYWDDGYPSGGNYWSDYDGVDLNSTPTQDIPPPDGFGDTNYTISGGSNVDNYPLMTPIVNYFILKPRWNLISIPLIQDNQDLSKVLEMIDGYYDVVQWFNITAKDDHWKHHKVGKPYGNDLSEINESMGFWIHITQPGDTIFFYSGTQPTENQTITLHPGWNMVGYPSLTSYNRTEGLNNLTFDDQVDAIWSYDAATQKWEEMGESDYFEIGKGYYIHAKSECEWEVPL